MVRERVRSILNEYQLKDILALVGILGTLVAVVRTGDRLIWNQEAMQAKLVQNIARTDSLASSVALYTDQLQVMKHKYIDRNSLRLNRIEEILHLPPLRGAE